MAITVRNTSLKITETTKIAGFGFTITSIMLKHLAIEINAIMLKIGAIVTITITDPPFSKESS
jgi:hypothetical protein